jgi:transcription initiation factor TFIID TATA-box-binding protein
MKQQKSNEESLSTNHILESSLESDDLDGSFETISSGNMMADSSFNTSVTTKMLMPHELGASNNVSTATLVGQHSIPNIHHGYHGYHSTATTNTNIGTGYNGYHTSAFPNYAHNLNGISTIANTATSSFSNLVHQQPITLSNNHSITTVTAISSTMPPPLIPYHQPTTQQQQTIFYTASNVSNTNEIGKKTNDIKQQQQQPITMKSESEKQEQQLPVVAKDEPEDDTECLETAHEQDTDEPEIDIVISNVVCAFSVRCHLALKEIALHGSNVEYKRENGMVTMKLRRPYTTASIWSSGKVTCTGATSEDQARIAARRTARMLQKLNFRVRFHNYRVVNVLGTCKMPWAIKIVQFSEKYKKEASYEPELHPGVTYNLKNPTATLKIFSTGSMTVTARSVADVQAAIEHIYPLVYEFKKPRVVNIVEEEVVTELIETDLEPDEDEDDDDVADPLELEESPPPPNKKQKLRDISHLSKRYKGPPSKRRPKRPLGKMNDPKQDLIYISDGDVDADDF